MSSSPDKAAANGGNKELHPPVVKLLDSALEGRIVDLRKHFIATFNEEPVFYVRVPGRVNLIGEHIDYCGYSVCPMAIKQDIVVAVRQTESRLVRLTNLDEKYPDFQCDINAVDIMKNGAPEWHSYFLCGVKGVIERLPEGSHAVGMMAAVMGNIPPNSGLSSSSALVSAAALSTSFAHKLKLTKQEIATLAAKSEQYIGTEGGGMDQAIAFLGTKGCAKHIEFNPLRWKDITLPSNAVFVIAHSLAEANKAATMDFNQRVAECRLACQVLAKHSGLEWEALTRLADLQKASGVSLDDMVSLVMSVLHEDPYTKAEICGILDVTEEKLNGLSLSKISTDSFPHFKLKQRALHVFQEARRVAMFCAACNNGGVDNESVLRTLGDLMRESHTSLQQLYECSHPDLDAVISAGQAEAIGARLTGAGWGGCVVALTTSATADNYIEELKKTFYSNHPLAQGRDLDSLVFATEPCDGAQVYITC